MSKIRKASRPSLAAASIEFAGKGVGATALHVGAQEDAVTSRAEQAGDKPAWVGTGWLCKALCHHGCHCAREPRVWWVPPHALINAVLGALGEE